MDVKFLIAGDRAVSVEFGKVICLETNEKVRMLEEKLKESPIEGVVEVVPTYCSLIVHYRPEVLLYDELVQALKERLENMHSVQKKKKIVKEIPILYGGETGPDLEYCAQLEQTSAEEIIRKHSEHEYYVYMLGFAPGHPYMARFEEPYSFKRRESPRVKIPARSVVVQLNLSDLIPFEQPCGWNIIGSTPLDICNFDKEEPFLLSAGDWVRHVPVTKDEYDRIRHDVENGTYKVKTYAAEENV
ncbi:MAG TPA: 5-oxoprolinase subunit PxpB [Candidatus Blautia merdipullorum]|nr:5-oxoprolinase subunit PxpB [Candidatus Blautia merdipullorum]